MKRAAWAVLALGIAGCAPSRFVLDVATEGGDAVEAGPDGADAMEDTANLDGAEASSGEGGIDAAPDAAESDGGIDAAIEAGPDAAAEGGPDAAMMGDALDAGGDAPGDVGVDAELEAGSDVGPDASAEAGPDASAAPLVELVSVNAAGTGAGDGASVAELHSVSDDGRYVVFSSRATNLVSPSIVFPAEPIDLVYVRDLRERTTTLLSRRADAASFVPNGVSYGAAISGDGGTVVFFTRATNIGPGGAPPPNDDARLYRWRRATGALDLITVEADGVTPISLVEGFGPILSRDGRHLFFSTRTRADLRAPRPRGEFNGFYVDLSQPAATRSFVLVTVGTTGMPPQFPPSDFCGAERTGSGANAGLVDISSDGRFAVTYTNGVGLVPGDSDGCADTYVFERGTTNTRRAINRTGVPASLRSFTIDDAGNNTLTGTIAALDPDDTDGLQDVYYGPINGDAWRRVSVPLAGRRSDGHAYRGRIDAAARRVLFTSTSSALVAGDTNNAADLFVRDLVVNTTTRVTTNADGSELAYGCTAIASCTADVFGELSGDGRSVVLISSAPLAGAADANTASDVYLRRLP